MSNSVPSSSDTVFQTQAIEAAIRIGLLLLLAAWCLRIVAPFIIPIAWGAIIAVATYPGYCRLYSALGERRKLAATLVTLLLLILLIVPTMLLAESLVYGVQTVADGVRSGTLAIPPPPERVGTWPISGEPLEDIWRLASVNLGEALREVGPQLRGIGAWLLSAAAGAGIAVLQFIIAIIVAGVLLANAEGCKNAAQALFTRLAPEKGARFAQLSGAMVRSVTRGILGVALIQSLLAGLGFLVVGMPAAGLWALLCLILGVMQLGVALVIIPLVIYVFSTADTSIAVIFLGWTIPVTLIDNVLKPILLGRGAPVPMLVIFLGAIGGFITSGIIGLFVGAVVLALGFELYKTWLGDTEPVEATRTSTG